MVKRFFLVCLACLVLSCGAGAETWTIDGGKGLGDKITLGMPLSTLDQFLTRTETSQTWGKEVYWVWYKEGLQAHIDQDKVYQLIITAPSAVIGGVQVDYVGQGGIRIGASLDDIERIYGRNHQSRPLKTAKGSPQEIYYVYPPQGIGFVLKAGRLHQIWVWPKAS